MHVDFGAHFSLYEMKVIGRIGALYARFIFMSVSQTISPLDLFKTTVSIKIYHYDLMSLFSAHLSYIVGVI